MPLLPNAATWNFDRVFDLRSRAFRCASNGFLDQLVFDLTFDASDTCFQLSTGTIQRRTDENAQIDQAKCQAFFGERVLGIGYRGKLQSQCKALVCS